MPRPSVPEPADAADRRSKAPVVCYPVETLPQPNLVALDAARQGLEKIEELLVPPRDARAVEVPKGHFFRIVSVEGPARTSVVRPPSWLTTTTGSVMHSAAVTEEGFFPFATTRQTMSRSVMTPIRRLDPSVTGISPSSRCRTRSGIRSRCLRTTRSIMWAAWPPDKSPRIITANSRA